MTSKTESEAVMIDAFEKWAKSEGLNTEKCLNDEYFYTNTRRTWTAWQAALSTRAEAVPVEAIYVSLDSLRQEMAMLVSLRMKTDRGLLQRSERLELLEKSVAALSTFLAGVKT